MATSTTDLAVPRGRPAARRIGHLGVGSSHRRVSRPDRMIRAGTSALLIVISVVHLHLWLAGYRHLPTIGSLFMLDGVAAALFSGVVAFRLNGVIAVAVASLAAGTLGANVLSLLLPAGLFHFKEVSVSYSGGFALAAETGTLVLLATWAYIHWRKGNLVPHV
jgi:hypothetical protein